MQTRTRAPIGEYKKMIDSRVDDKVRELSDRFPRLDEQRLHAASQEIVEREEFVRVYGYGGDTVHCVRGYDKGVVDAAFERIARIESGLYLSNRLLELKTHDTAFKGIIAYKEVVMRERRPT